MRLFILLTMSVFLVFMAIAVKNEGGGQAMDVRPIASSSGEVGDTVSASPEDNHQEWEFCTLPYITCEGQKASWYRYKLNGIWWSDNHLTAASRDLPRYSYARVTNLENGKSVKVYINDYVENPNVDIDLSHRAFKEIANPKLGIINVKIKKYEQEKNNLPSL